MRFALLATGMAAFLLLVADGQGADKVDADKDKIQGTWVVESIESGSFKSKPPKDKKTSYVFEGDKLTMKDQGKADKKGTFKIDGSKKPKEIDFISEKETMKAVYELDGDTLKIAYPPTADKRPTAVDPKDATVFTLKKEKK